MDDIILETRNLTKTFGLRKHGGKTVRAVNGVSIKVKRGETFGLVGESGCGKSTLARLILRLIEADSGEVLFIGQDLRTVKKSQLKHLRRDMQMIFQKPYESLNPRLTVREIISAPLEIHKLAAGLEKDRRVRELLDLVGLSQSALEKYPHEFSGGQRQRIGIARALSLNPQLIICDEPVSALDVSIQSQILNLLKDLQQELSLTYIFISHNLAVVKYISDTIGVMYAGHIVEIADADEFYTRPLHPYSKALQKAIPGIREKKLIESELDLVKREILEESNEEGCPFKHYCSLAEESCCAMLPDLLTNGNSHQVACHFVNKKV